MRKNTKKVIQSDESNDEKISELEERIEDLESLEGKIDDLEYNMSDKAEVYTMDELESRMDELESKIEEIQQDLGKFGKAILAYLEATVSQSTMFDDVVSSLRDTPSLHTPVRDSEGEEV